MWINENELMWKQWMSWELEEGLIQHKQHKDTACLYLSPLRKSKMSRMIPSSFP